MIKAYCHKIKSGTYEAGLFWMKMCPTYVKFIKFLKLFRGLK